MIRKTRLTLTAIITLLFVSLASCTIQGLPYPTETPDSNMITPDLKSTREMAEAGMFPSTTPEPDTPTMPPSTPKAEVPTPTVLAFRIPSQTLKLVYILNGDLWYWKEGQAPIQLTKEGDAYLAALSDDASQAAFARELDYGSRELWVVNTDGSGARVLVDSLSFQEMTLYPDDLTGAPLQLDWVPETNLVVFSTRIIYEGPGMVRKHELHTVDVDSRTMTVLADIDHGGRFKIAPDGRQIAMSLPDRINLVQADGSGLRELYSFPHLDTGSEWFYYPTVAWTQDSAIVRLILPPEHPMSELEQPTQILSLPASGSSPRIVGEVLTIPVFYVNPILSPDARQLAYVGPVSFENPGTGILYTASVNGSGAVSYDKGLIALYAWSPDNRHFLYSVNGLNKIGNIDTPANSLKVPGYLLNTRFFDPSHFLLISQKGDQLQLWLGDLDGEVIFIGESSSAIDYDFVR